MTDASRRSVLSGLVALAGPVPACASSDLASTVLPFVAPAPALPEVRSVELTLQHLLGARRWQDDLYAGRIALHISGQGHHWAILREDIVSVGIRCWTNQHDLFKTQEQFVADHGEGFWPNEAIGAGWITIGEPLNEEESKLVHRVRFGRVGIVLREGLMLCDGGNIDFS